MACLANGLGRKALNGILSLLNIPSIRENLFKKCQEDIKRSVEQSLKESIDEAIALEKSNCDQEGLIDSKGNSLIAAIGDAGWSKRSYRTNYNANSCAGVLIGCYSKKILMLVSRINIVVSVQHQLKQKKTESISALGTMKGLRILWKQF